MFIWMQKSVEIHLPHYEIIQLSSCQSTIRFGQENYDLIRKLIQIMASDLKFVLKLFMSINQLLMRNCK